MKKFFMLVSILASAMITQSAFAGSIKTCQWTVAPTPGWACVSGSLLDLLPGYNSTTKIYKSGVKCSADLDCQGLVVNDDCLNFGTHCGEVSAHQSFDFNISAGGANLDLYVCEVGFANKHCKNCGAEEIKFYNAQGPLANVVAHDGNLLINVLKYWVFDKATAPTSADLFINDLNEDVGFYVKYCADFQRLWVGTKPTNSPVFTLNDKITLTPGSATDPKTYFNANNLRAMVFKNCGSLTYKIPGLGQYGETLFPLLQFDGFGQDEEQTADLPHDITKLEGGITKDGETCYSGHCSWTVLYKEMNHCMVRTTDVTPTNYCHDGVCGHARKAKITTRLDLNLDFCPVESNGECGI